MELKYFDSKGNFSPEIRCSYDLFSHKEQWGFPKDLYDEVDKNWKYFPADSDIVGFFWISEVNRTEPDDCGLGVGDDTYMDRIIFQRKQQQ